MQSYESFENFVKKRPGTSVIIHTTDPYAYDSIREISVLKTFEKELEVDGLNALKILERARLTEGEAMPDEVTQVVKNRNGAILSASTILKSDFFSNLQKMSLPEYVYP